jgi:hypothetical protein
MRFSGAGSVIVLAVFGQDVIQVAHIEDEQVIQTLLTHAAYPSLSMRIGVRGMVWCEDDLHIFEPQTPYQIWRTTSYHGHAVQSLSFALVPSATTPVVVPVALPSKLLVSRCS